MMYLTEVSAVTSTSTCRKLRYYLLYIIFAYFQSGTWTQHLATNEVLLTKRALELNASQQDKNRLLRELSKKSMMSSKQNEEITRLRKQICVLQEKVRNVTSLHSYFKYVTMFVSTFTSWILYFFFSQKELPWSVSNNNSQFDSCTFRLSLTYKFERLKIYCLHDSTFADIRNFGQVSFERYQFVRCSFSHSCIYFYTFTFRSARSLSKIRRFKSAWMKLMKLDRRSPPSWRIVSANIANFYMPFGYVNDILCQDSFRLFSTYLSHLKVPDHPTLFYYWSSAMLCYDKSSLTPPF